jgi:isopentenyl-diphosphate Delta-isomerase
MTEISDRVAVEEELVVLLNERLDPVATSLKQAVHTENTPLHLAFSCYLFNRDGQVLVTRRAMGKKTWPGVWSNSFCGHPGPGEDMSDAIRRRARQELNVTVSELRNALPEFRYRAVDASGIVENEFCPVWTATANSDPGPDEAEVSEWQWIEWNDLVSIVGRAPYLFSPWSQLQVPQLASAGHPLEIG